jgi:hypothetical protein
VIAILLLLLVGAVLALLALPRGAESRSGAGAPPASDPPAEPRRGAPLAAGGASAGTGTASAARDGVPSQRRLVHSPARRVVRSAPAAGEVASAAPRADAPPPGNAPAASGDASEAAGGSASPGRRPARFAVVGSVAGLTLGVWRQIPVRITNPNPEPIEVTALRVEISGSPNGCDAAANFDTRPSATPFMVPANAVSYPVPVAKRPSIRIEDRATNQGPCKGQRFALSFIGEAYA